VSVKEWPTYLLRDIPEATRAAIERDAEENQQALIEVIREILCGHYELDCDPVDSPRTPYTEGKDEMVLRLQPALWSAIREDAGVGYGSTRKTILSILSAHYA